MRRNIKSVLRYLLLGLLTIGTTVVIFRLIRQPIYDRPEIVIIKEARGPMPRPPFPFFNEFDLDNEKIDWHDYKAIKDDAKRAGIGEHGKPAHLSADEADLKEKLYKVNGFNAALSDKIALDRSIPDIRHPGCQTKKYLKNLPSVSVIIPFHNEHWSTLLRTVYSVINRSPSQLLREVILVDDFSTKDFTKKPLDDYIYVNLTKVKIIHLPDRQGLIRARLAGARAATADVLVFLDSHTEANINWLPPLLDPIAQDYRTCVCPFIDVVAYDTFEYRSQDEGARGAFDWEFYYKRLPLLPEDLKYPTEPFKSPVMAGGLFAISTKFFWELGGYDEGLDIWGGEQYELSFKIWQCGGQMYDAPCSRVGHIYRKFAPFPNPGRGDFVAKNYRRVAEVWMDEYAQYLYARRPHYKDVDPGDLTERKALRAKLKCKPFKWFMKNIAFDLVLKYPLVEPEDFANGKIVSIAAPELCIDAGHLEQEVPIGLSDCGSRRQQYFNMTWHKDVRPKGSTNCWDVSSPLDKASVVLYPCHGMKGNQLWKYDVNRQWLIHGRNPRCLDSDPGAKKLYVTDCDDKSLTQKWRIEHVDLKALTNWESIGPV